MINTSKWDTNVSSWGQWSWDPKNAKVITSVEPNNASTYLALTMSYEKHVRAGQTYYYKAGILKSTLPAGVAYGRFEARIKGASRWPGVCPAFWAYRHGSDPSNPYWIELDFAEMLENRNNVKDIDFTSHVFPPTPGIKPPQLSNSTHKVFDFDPRDEFHVYAMEWNSSNLTWWVDGVNVKQIPASPYFNRSDWPMDVVLSFGLRPPLRESPSAVGFPTAFFVDWVRVWQRDEYLPR
jgi:beta-glucanase (GH16 family)